MLSLPGRVFLKFRMDRLMWYVYFELCFAASAPVLLLENKLPAATSTPDCRIPVAHHSSCYQVGSQEEFCFRPTAPVSRAAVKIRN